METKSLDVFVTGYGPFMGMENPTEKLVNLVEEMKGEINSDLGEGVNVRDTQVFEVTKKGIDNYIEDFWTKVKDSPAKKKLIVHFGLYDGITSYNLERNAFNWLSDWAIGYNKTITPKGPKKAQTNLNIDSIAENLRNRGLPVKTSEDAGRYYCNYIFYLSTCAMQNQDVSVIFVHIPNEKTKSVTEGVQFLSNFIAEVAK